MTIPWVLIHNKGSQYFDSYMNEMDSCITLTRSSLPNPADCAYKRAQIHLAKYEAAREIQSLL